MLQSYLFSNIKNALSKSYFLNFLINQVDVKEELKYESVIIDSFYKPIVHINSLLDRIANHTYIKALSRRIDLKSVVIFVFIVSQVLFPGYGTENTGTALLPGSPVGSVANRSGFVLNLLVFFITLSSLGIIFLKDITKNSKAFRLSKFDVLILIFILSIAVSSIFSVYPNITFTWFLKVLRGISMYFIFSRLIIKKGHTLTICLAFLSIIYIESFLAIFQYIHGGFVGLPIETAQNAASPNQLYAFIDFPVFRPTGTLSQANILTFILALAAPFSVFFIISDKFIYKILGIVALLLSVCISIISLSRWGFLTLIFSLFLSLSFLFFRKIIRSKINWGIRILSVLTIAIITLFSFQYLFVSRFAYFSFVDSSFTARMQLITQALYVFSHNVLFGIGGKNFSTYLISHDFTPLHISSTFPAPVHNLYFLLLSENGLLTTILFIISSIYLVTTIFNTVGKVKIITNLPAIFILTLLASIVTYLFNGLWELRFLDEHLIIIYWMMIGICFNRSPLLNN